MVKFHHAWTNRGFPHRDDKENICCSVHFSLASDSGFSLNYVPTRAPVMHGVVNTYMSSDPNPKKVTRRTFIKRSSGTILAFGIAGIPLTAHAAKWKCDASDQSDSAPTCTKTPCTPKAKCTGVDRTKVTCYYINVPAPFAPSDCGITNFNTSVTGLNFVGGTGLTP